MNKKYAFLLWSTLVCTVVISSLAWVLAFATDPDYYKMAAAISAFVGIAFLIIYSDATIHVLRNSERAASKASILSKFWIGLFLLFLILSVLPDENRDEFAFTRYLIGLVAIGSIAAVQFFTSRAVSSK